MTTENFKCHVAHITFLLDCARLVCYTVLVRLSSIFGILTIVNFLVWLILLSPHFSPMNLLIF